MRQARSTSSSNTATAPPLRDGFSLLEVIVAMTVLGVGILGVMAALSMSLRIDGESTRLVGAVEVAERELVAATLVPTGSIQATRGVDGTYQWTVAYAQKSEQLFLVSVTVQWMARSEAKQYRLSRAFRPPSEDQ